MVLEFLADYIGTFAIFVLIPVLIALLMFVLTEFFSSRKGIELSTEFHKKSFGLAVSMVIGWLVFTLIPGDIYLPMQALGIRFVFGLFLLVLTAQYLVYAFSEIISPTKTVLSLGFIAGLFRTTLAVGVVGKMAADNEEFSSEAGASIMLANSVMILRNFFIVLIVGIWLGLFRLPPLSFAGPMLLMFLACIIITFVNHKRSMGVGEGLSFELVSFKNLALFMALFIIMYYFAIGLLDYAGFLGLYAMSGAAGFLYGSAHIFILASMLFGGVISLEIAFSAALFVTIGSILSDIPYAYVQGASRLTKILLVSEIIPVVIGVLSWIYFIW